LDSGLVATPGSPRDPESLVERITSRRLTRRTLPPWRETNSPSSSGSEDVLRVARPFVGGQV
jgi:hypothetical protein